MDLEKALASFDKADSKNSAKEKVLYANAQILFRLCAATRKRHMRNILLLAVALPASFLLGPGSGTSAELTRVRVGYPSPSASFTPLFVAKEAGLFEKHGLSAELLYLQGVQMTQVNLARQLDFTVTGSPLPLQASVQGADLVLAAQTRNLGREHPNPRC